MLFHKAASTGFCAGACCLAAKPSLSGGFFGGIVEFDRVMCSVLRGQIGIDPLFNS